MQEAVAGLGLQYGALFANGVDEILLRRRALGEALVERGVMFISATSKFLYQRLVSLIERFLFPHPTQCLWVARIPAPKICFGSGRPIMLG